MERLAPALLAAATFILGSWLAPKMEWIPNSIKIWIFAFGIGLFIFAILNFTPVKQYPIGLTQHFIVVIITALSLLVFIGAGFVLQHIEQNYRVTNELRVAADALLGEITQFVADRALSQPQATADWNSPDEWFQKSREYSSLTNNLFISRFYQRIMDLGHHLKRERVITQDELDHLNFWNNPQYPGIDFVLKALQDYRSRIKK